jgi:hypothetical protein
MPPRRTDRADRSRGGHHASGGSRLSSERAGEGSVPDGRFAAASAGDRARQAGCGVRLMGPPSIPSIAPPCAPSTSRLPAWIVTGSPPRLARLAWHGPQRATAPPSCDDRLPRQRSPRGRQRCPPPGDWSAHQTRPGPGRPPRSARWRCARSTVATDRPASSGRQRGDRHPNGHTAPIREMRRPAPGQRHGPRQRRIRRRSGSAARRPAGRESRCRRARGTPPRDASPRPRSADVAPADAACGPGSRHARRHPVGHPRKPVPAKGEGSWLVCLPEPSVAARDRVTLAHNRSAGCDRAHSPSDGCGQ